MTVYRGIHVTGGGLFSRYRGKIILFFDQSPSQLRFFPHSFQGTDLPSHGTGPSTNPTGLQRNEERKRERALQRASSPASGFIHAPSLMRSMMSLTSKLISSVSWPVYWYMARQRGPVGRGWVLGAGRGRWVMLFFLCFLWRRQRNVKIIWKGSFMLESHLSQPFVGDQEIIHKFNCGTPGSSGFESEWFDLRNSFYPVTSFF